MKSRLQREAETIEAMIDLWCLRNHAADRPRCAECQALLDYALERLGRCPFGADKPTCAHCTVHCYRPDMRQRVRAVMRGARAHMLYRHPILALRHLLVDSRRPTPRSRR